MSVQFAIVTHSTVLMAVLAFALIFGGAIVGFALGKVLPDQYRGGPTEKVVQNAARMLSLLSLLVLGLLVATAKSKFDSSDAQSVHFAGSLMLLHADLANYGPETEEIQVLLKKLTVASLAETWRLKGVPRPDPDDPPIPKLIEMMQEKLLKLPPGSEYQRAMAKAALEIVTDLQRTRWLRKALEADQSPAVFVWVLLAWIVILFVAFGLYAPPNLVTVAALLVSALSIAGAIGLIVDLESPFSGLVTVSPAPMREALAEMSAPPVRRGN